MDGKRWQDRALEPIRGTLGKLSSAQRLSLGLLAASLLVGLGTLALGGGAGEEMALVPIADPARARDFAGWLTEERIPHEVTSSGVEVRNSDLAFVQLRARVGERASGALERRQHAKARGRAPPLRGDPGSDGELHPEPAAQRDPPPAG